MRENSSKKPKIMVTKIESITDTAQFKCIGLFCRQIFALICHDNSMQTLHNNELHENFLKHHNMWITGC